MGHPWQMSSFQCLLHSTLNCLEEEPLEEEPLEEGHLEDRYPLEVGPWGPIEVLVATAIGIQARQATSFGQLWITVGDSSHSTTLAVQQQHYVVQRSCSRTVAPTLTSFIDCSLHRSSSDRASQCCFRTGAQLAEKEFMRQALVSGLSEHLELKASAILGTRFSLWHLPV